MAARSNESIQQYDAGIKSALAVNVASDVTLVNITRAVYVGTSGDLVVQFANDADAGSVKMVGLAAGLWHPIQIQKIIASGSTASNVLVGY